MDDMNHRLTDRIMALAIAEAKKGAGFVSPNPQVGCVILNSQGQLIGQGYHHKFGGPHAEVQALLGLSSTQLQGAKVFVTLEPCAHQGKTPSCARTLAQLPLAEVIYGLVDPNPLVAGQGAEILRQAGIMATLYQGKLADELEEVCEHFLINYRKKRPFISIKVASSLDGQMGLASGESQWITGPEAKKYAHYLRATHEAILIGQRTFELDNPSLNIRHPDFPNKKNKVIIVLGPSYSDLRPLKSNIFKVHESGQVSFLEKTEEGYFDLQIDKMGRLQRLGVSPEWNLNFTRRVGGDFISSSILIEGGAQVISSYLMRSEADRLYLFQAPILLGAKGGKAWSERVMINSMAAKISLRNQQVHQLGQDVLITGRLSYVN